MLVINVIFNKTMRNIAENI